MRPLGTSLGTTLKQARARSLKCLNMKSCQPSDRRHRERQGADRNVHRFPTNMFGVGKGTARIHAFNQLRLQSSPNSELTGPVPVLFKTPRSTDARERSKYCRRGPQVGAAPAAPGGPVLPERGRHKPRKPRARFLPGCQIVKDGHHLFQMKRAGFARAVLPIRLQGSQSSDLVAFIAAPALAPADRKPP